MPLQQTSGNVTADAYGGGVAAAPLYIEDFFQTYLRTGTGASASVTTGLNGSTKETLVWTKSRSAATDHKLTDNVRGATKALSSNTTGAEATDSQGLTAFNATGYTIGTNTDYNNSGATYVDWQWVSQPKFFDVVTWTGDGIANRLIPHSLTSTPGFIVVKRTDTTSDWKVHDASTGFQFCLNLTDAANSFSSLSGGYPGLGTSTTFRLFEQSGSLSAVNASGGTYVAYVFASNAGGFGLTGTDNVITCGNFTTDGSGNASVNLGYEPQFWLYKPTIAARYWTIYDVMRGWAQTQIRNLNPNVADAEGGGAAHLFYPTATGFDCVGSALDPSTQHIYIAIRRGPMKVPTLGTQVYNGVTRTGTGSATNVTGAGFPPDLVILESLLDPKGSFSDRLRWPTKLLNSYETAAEATDTNGVTSFSMDGMAVGVGNNANRSGFDYVYWFLRRYPSVFDEVCYSGTGAVGNAVSHNLGVAPELMLIKGRAGTVGANDWQTLANISSGGYIKLFLNRTDAALGPYNYTINAGLAAQPTSTNFTVNNVANFNNGSTTYVAYLFATCPGVSKVGTYTGNGTTQTINCGFGAGGARFVLIKQTDTTGDWYVYDTARGMTVLTDPYLRLNVNSAETATLGSVTTVATGFALNSAILAAINVNAGTYIFLAIS